MVVSKVLGFAGVVVLGFGGLGGPRDELSIESPVTNQISTQERGDVATALTQLERLAEEEDWQNLKLEATQLLERLPKEDSVDRAKAHAFAGKANEQLLRFDSALTHRKEALSIFRRLFPRDHAVVSESLNNLAFCHFSMGNAATALPLFEEALAMDQRIFPGDSPEVVMSLNNLAACHENLGNSDKALLLYQQALAMVQRIFPGDRPEVASSLNNLAACHENLGNADKALPLYQLALAMVQRIFPGDHPDVAMSLNNLANCHHILGDAAKAFPILEQALAMRQRLFPRDHPDVAMSLSNLASCHKSLGNADKALPLFVEALAMLQRIFPGDHPDVAMSLTNLASCHASLGNADKGLPLSELALAMYTRIFPRDHPHVAMSLNNLAAYHQELGNHVKALPLHEKALAMRLRIFPEDHPDVAISLLNLASCHAELGTYDRALPLYLKALAMNQRNFPEDHPVVARSFNGLAFVYEKLGNSAKALALYGQALAMNQRIFPGDHPVVAVSMNYLASCQLTLGEPAKALTLFEQTLAMRQRIFSGDHPAIAMSMNNLAGCHETLGAANKALPLYLEALAMNQRIFLGDHPFVANSLDSLAGCQASLGAYAEALPLFEQALAMRQRVFPGDHPVVAISLSNLASCHASLENASRALRFCEQALAMGRKVFGQGHPNLSASLLNYARILEELKRKSEAMSARRDWLSSASVQIESMSGLADAGLSVSTFNEFVSDVSRMPSYSFSELFASASSLRYRLSRTGQASLVQDLVDKDPELSRFRDAYLITSKKVSDLAMDTRANESDRLQAKSAADIAYARYLTSLKDRHGKRLRLDPPSYAELRKSLGATGAAVDIYRRTDRKAPYYLAAVTTGQGPVRFVELGSEAAIGKELDGLLNQMSEKNQGAGSEPFLRRLDALTLGKLDGVLKGKTRIFLAADGVLAQVPFSGLVTGYVKDADAPSGKRASYRLERMRISLVPSILDTALPMPAASGRGAALVADVDYGARVGKAGESRYQPYEPARPSKTRGLDENGNWTPLSSGTAETKALRATSIFRHASVLTKASASEEKVAGLVSPKYLHVSTHGYFTPYQLSSSKNLFMDQVSKADDSMVRSGLILAGANRARPGSGIPSSQDGWLTASEASRMRLRGTRLVTLAACSTGRGDVSVGLGVLGLRRAFRTAGAQGVVMSLFDVPDPSTQKLMQTFYAGLSKGLSAPEALHRAQKEMVRQRYTPYHWAAFVYEGGEK